MTAESIITNVLPGGDCRMTALSATTMGHCWLGKGSPRGSSSKGRTSTSQAVLRGIRVDAVELLTSP